MEKPRTNDATTDNIQNDETDLVEDNEMAEENMHDQIAERDM